MLRIALISYSLYTKCMADITSIAEVSQGLARVGRGAGARPGDWRLGMVESGDIREDGWLDLTGLREVGVVRSVRTERHLLRPYDVLVTARAGLIQVALVPPYVSRTVAGITLLVVRPKDPETGMGHWLWYFLSSTHGKSQIAKRQTVNATVTSLSAANLREIKVPHPSPRKVDHIARLVEASEAAYETAVEAARLRRSVLRDAIISQIGRTESLEQWSKP